MHEICSARYFPHIIILPFHDEYFYRSYVVKELEVQLDDFCFWGLNPKKLEKNKCLSEVDAKRTPCKSSGIGILGIKM